MARLAKDYRFQKCARLGPPVGCARELTAMNAIDFIIGLTLVNSIPHFVLGVWRGRMISGLGIGDTQNILYGLINFTVSIALFLYKYGVEGLTENSMYLGGLFVVVSYFVVGKFIANRLHHSQSAPGAAAKA